MTRFGAGALIAGALSLNGCAAIITPVLAGISAAKSIYDFTGTVASDADKIVAVSCKAYYDKRIKASPGDPAAVYGDAYCANPPAGSDPVESAIWLGQLVEMMQKDSA